MRLTKVYNPLPINYNPLKVYNPLSIIYNPLLCELGYQMILAKDLKYIDINFHKEIEIKIIQVKKMLNAFINKINLRLDTVT